MSDPRYYSYKQKPEPEPAVIAVKRYQVTFDIEVEVHDITAERVPTVEGAETEPHAAQLNGLEFQTASEQRQMLLALLANPNLLDRFLRDRVVDLLLGGVSENELRQRAFGPAVGEKELKAYFDKTIVVPAALAEHYGNIDHGPGELFYLSFRAEIRGGSIRPT